MALAASKHLAWGEVGVVREISWVEASDGDGEKTKSSRFPFSSLASLSDKASILDLVRFPRERLN